MVQHDSAFCQNAPAIGVFRIGQSPVSPSSPLWISADTQEHCRNDITVLVAGISTCLGSADYSFLFGNPGDKPVVGDWDGSGTDEIGLHRETTGLFYWRNTLTSGIADGSILFGNPGDRFVAGDRGIVDDRDTPAVFRPADATIYFRHTLSQGTADSHMVWPGAKSSWIPVSGQFEPAR
jgi:hypothetical protein